MLQPAGQSQRSDLDLVFFSIAAARAPLATTADNRISESNRTRRKGLSIEPNSSSWRDVA
jgi:hypothetical protein